MRDILSKLDNISKPIILEAGVKDQIKQMFANIPEFDLIKDYVNSELKWAKTHLNTSEQIIWWMRLVRIHALNILIGKINNRQYDKNPVPEKSNDDNIRTIGQIINLRDKAIQTLNKNSDSSYQFSRLDALVKPDVLNPLKQKFIHFMGLGIQEINRMEFGWKHPTTILMIMEEIEEEWKETRERMIKPEGDEDIILDFPEDKMAWVMLPRGYCPTEGDAMGHCGNVANRPGERILSLRKFHVMGDEIYHEPFLTFILDENGWLGEMKGRGNDKPAEKYHKYIIPLLKSNIVDGIKGGGYLPEHNFDLNDLDGKTKMELIDEKPELGGVLFLIKKEGFSDKVRDILYTRLEAHNIAPDDLDFEMGPNDDLSRSRIVLKKWRDFEHFVSDIFDKPLMDLVSILEGEYELEVDPGNSLSDDRFIELIRRLPEYYQEKIFKEAGTDDPERAYWRLERDRHRYYQYMVRAFERAYETSDDLKKKVKDRIKEYIDSGWDWPAYGAYVDIEDDLNEPVYLKIDFYEFINIIDSDEEDDEYGHQLMDIKSNDWHNPNWDNTNENRGEYADDGPLVDKSGDDLFIKSLKNMEGKFKIEMDSALDYFEDIFKLKESKEKYDRDTQLIESIRNFLQG